MLCHEHEGRTAAHDAFYRLCGQRVENIGRTFPDRRVGQLIALFAGTRAAAGSPNVLA